MLHVQILRLADDKIEALFLEVIEELEKIDEGLLRLLGLFHFLHVLVARLFKLYKLFFKMSLYVRHILVFLVYNRGKDLTLYIVDHGAKELFDGL